MSSPLVYDPLTAFVTVFSNPATADDIAVTLTCDEVNVLVGLLEPAGRPDAAARWLTSHLLGCDDPRRH